MNDWLAVYRCLLKYGRIYHILEIQIIVVSRHTQPPILGVSMVLPLSRPAAVTIPSFFASAQTHSSWAFLTKFSFSCVWDKCSLSFLLRMDGSCKYPWDWLSDNRSAIARNDWLLLRTLQKVFGCRFRFNWSRKGSGREGFKRATPRLKLFVILCRIRWIRARMRPKSYHIY